jgi:hypothetical protein
MVARAAPKLELSVGCQKNIRLSPGGDRVTVLGKLIDETAGYLYELLFNSARRSNGPRLARNDGRLERQRRIGILPITVKAAGTIGVSWFRLTND